MRKSLPTLIALAAAAILMHSARSEDQVEDFESLTSELKGWSATAPDENGQAQYRVASKWDTPFSFSISSEKPHSGSNCLKWEFTEEVPGVASAGPLPIPATGPAIEIRFFVRSEGLNSPGLLAFDESDASGKRLNGHWAVAKIPLGEDWQEVVWGGRIEPSAAAVRIRLVFKSVPAGAKIWFDDLKVKTLPDK